MKTALTFLFALSMSICQAQWTTIINDAINDSGNLEGTLLEYQHDQIADEVLFRFTFTNLAAFSDAPSADFSFAIPGGLESGNASGAHWSSTTPVDKTAFVYCDPGGTPPNAYTFGAWAQRIEETASTNVLCNNCVSINVDVAANQITYTFNRTDILSETERGGAAVVTIGLVANVGSNVAWDDAITHNENGPSNANFTLNFPNVDPCASFTFNTDQTMATCTADDGQLEITALNGTPPYQYSIDDGNTWQTMNTFTDLAARAYEVSVMDDAACVANMEITVEKESLNFHIASVTPAMCGNATGAIQVGAPGLGEHTYRLNGAIANTTGLFEELAPGNYQVQVTNQDGCSGSTTVEIENDNDLDVHVDQIKPIDCYYFDNGAIDFHLGGGEEPFAFRLDMANEISSESYFDGLSLGQHNIQISDARGCTDEINFTITRSTNGVSADCPCTVFTPTAFTPDSDGLNDNFKVVPSCPVKDYNLKIYNRTGQLVFESSNVTDVWNGSAGDEYYLESSLFTYQLTYAWGEGNGLSDLKNLTGTVLLVR